MKNWSKYMLILLISFILACGNEGRTKDLEKENPGSSEIVPCELLTIEQVKTVLPGTGEGFTASSGESLMKGVKSYQCSYSDEKYNLLTVIVHVASAKKDFDWIKPSKNIGDDYKDARKLDIGDGGWLYGDPKDMKVEVVKGYTVIELHLSSDNANEKGESLIELASIVVKKIGQS